METTVKIKNPAIRCYSKTDLAMLYFPDAKPHTALCRLSRWIKKCTALADALASLHLSPSKAFFRPKEVECIFEYLGEP
jgi:hypothetical protein